MKFPKCNNSQFIQSIQYNKKAEVLYLVMNGKQYKYVDVPNEIVEGLLAAESKGVYFNAFIKGQYYALKNNNLKAV